MTEDEMIGWHHRLNAHEFEQALGDGEGQGSLLCFSPWSLKESDMIQRLNNNNNSFLCVGVCPMCIQYKQYVHKQYNRHWRRKWQFTPIFLPRKFPWTEEPDSPLGCRVVHDQVHIRILLQTAVLITVTLQYNLKSNLALLSQNYFGYWSLL